MCWSKKGVVLLWLFSVAFAIGAWLLIVASCSVDTYEDRYDMSGREDIFLIDQDGWIPGQNPDATYSRVIVLEEEIDDDASGDE